ncbi:MAG: hypothetical protein ACOCTT_04085 [archaeon]
MKNKKSTTKKSSGKESKDKGTKEESSKKPKADSKTKVNMEDVFDSIDDWYQNSTNPRVKDLYPILIVDLKKKIKDDCK